MIRTLPVAELSYPSEWPASQRWSPLKRFLFRLALCYFLLSVLTVSGVLGLIPWGLGYKIESGIDHVWSLPVQWLGQHLFHLSGIAVHPHSTDSRDEALDWITTGLIVTVSLVSAALWSVLDRHRRNYRTAAAWLRFWLRLTLVFLMFRYGLMKVFPLQMSPPSLAVLNEPVGNMSPMTLLWTLIGLHPAYEILCGAIETAAAVLLFFRRTALLGALLTLFVMTNVLLFNMFFDVPVKLGAANLLLLAVAVLAPDLGALYSFFWRREAAAPTAGWGPPGGSRAFRRGTYAFEVLFLVLVLVQFVPWMSQEAAQERASVRHPSPLTGEWRVDSALRTTGGHTVSLPVLTGEGLPMTALYLEPDGRAMARSSDGKLWRAQAYVDMAKRTVALSSGYFDSDRFDANYSLAQPDPTHLVLTPVGRAAARDATISLTRVPLPSHYFLLDRGFHWVNEWALER